MAHPIEPSFGRYGEYSTGRTATEAFRQGTLNGNMYHGNGYRQEPITWWQRVTMRADSIRDAMGDRCCRCLHHMPSLVLIIGILVLIGLAIAAVPIAFILISNAGQAAPLKGDLSSAGGTSFQPIRHGSAEWPGYNEEIDLEDEEDTNSLRAISAAAMFPPNVSLCHGFGFACTSQPSRIVSTFQRCDGVADCPDGSDELHCRECQSPFWCEISSGESSKAQERICLKGSSLCDGIPHCSNGSDEHSKYCRPSNSVCETGSRRCAHSPLCLPDSSFCDGEEDCREGDDERGCKECRRGAKMCKATGTCIPRSQQCDGIVNCPDGSDEVDCDCKACSGSDRALCSNGRCLERSKVCDGTIDCLGGMDEESCPGTCRASPSATLKKIKCADGRHYSESEACSGLIMACSRSCEKCDAKLAFTCPSDGQCIPKMLVCNGQKDCAGGEDEADCKDACAVSGAFKCADGKKCVPSGSRCDGVRDCEDGSDEKKCDKCPSSSLHCVKDGACFPSSARCDGTRDCSDGSDESNCSCTDCTASRSDTYACESSNHCFKRDSVCSPYTRCPNATKNDKLFCAAQNVQRGLF